MKQNLPLVSLSISNGGAPFENFRGLEVGAVDLGLWVDLNCESACGSVFSTARDRAADGVSRRKRVWRLEICRTELKTSLLGLQIGSNGYQPLEHLLF